MFDNPLTPGHEPSPSVLNDFLNGRSSARKSGPLGPMVEEDRGDTPDANKFLSGLLEAMLLNLNLHEQNYVLRMAVVHIKDERQRRYENLVHSAEEISESINGLLP